MTDQPHLVFFGPTRSGKATMMLHLMEQKLHPKGVVQGEVVTDSGELESGETDG